MLAMMSFCLLDEPISSMFTIFPLLIYKLISSNNTITWDHYSSYRSKSSVSIWDPEVKTS
jgi:hypothetical protein